VLAHSGASAKPSIARSSNALEVGQSQILSVPGVKQSSAEQHVASPRNGLRKEMGLQSALPDSAEAIREVELRYLTARYKWVRFGVPVG